MRTIRLTTIALAAALALPAIAKAQTEVLKFEGVKNLGGDQVNGHFTGPYRASRAPFSTPATTFDIFCIDYDNSAQATWTAHYLTFADATGAFSVQAHRQLGSEKAWGLQDLRDAAYLSAKFASAPLTQWDDIHGAIWSLFSTGVGPLTAGMSAQLADANANAGASWDSYQLVVDDKVFAADWANNPQVITQGFITEGSNVTTTAVTPEPSTYALFAAGLVAIGFARRRRRTA